jgi:hypothetical protein
LLLCGSYFDKVSRKISLQTVQAFEEGGWKVQKYEIAVSHCYFIMDSITRGMEDAT